MVNLSSRKNDMVQLDHYLSDSARAKENLFRVSDRRYHSFQEKYSRIAFFRWRTGKEAEKMQKSGYNKKRIPELSASGTMAICRKTESGC